MDFDFYNVTSIHGFTFMLTVVFANTIMLWVFPTSSKGSPIHIIRFTLTTLMNEKHPCKCVRVYKYSELANSIDVKNLLVDEFKISMETTGDDASRINVNNERHNISIRNMVRAYILDRNHHENKW